LRRYKPYNEGVYPLFDCAKPERWVAEVERHTYFQLSVTLPHRSNYHSYATYTLSGSCLLRN